MPKSPILDENADQDPSYLENLKALAGAAMDKVGSRIDEMGQAQKTTEGQMRDRLNAALHPEQAGPPLPTTTPEEKKMYTDLAEGGASAVGSVENMAQKAALRGLSGELAPALEKVAAGANTWGMIPKKAVPEGAIKSGLNMFAPAEGGAIPRLLEKAKAMFPGISDAEALSKIQGGVAPRDSSVIQNYLNRLKK